MATISVVQYTSGSPHKMNVLQQSTNTNNNERREIIILRKPPQVIGQAKEFSKDDILITNTAKKKPIFKPKEGAPLTKPAPMAVARRNARERNRVKQVNNGFANLRQHIPNSIAAAFESSNGRGGNKKLSKVETLRMAVEYIRRLEEILSSTEDGENQEHPNLTSYPSPTLSSSPTLTTQANLTYASYPMLSPSADEDDLSTNATPPPQQYVKIQGANGYQLIPVQFYEDSENLEPLDDHLLSDPSLLSSDLEFTGVQDLSLLNSMQTNGSLSPEMYSDSSLSPSSLEKSASDNRHPQQIYNIPVFNNSPSIEEVKLRLAPPNQSIKPEEHHPLISLQPDVKYRLSPEVLSSDSKIRLQNVKMEHDNHQMNILQSDVKYRMSPNLQEIKSETHEIIAIPPELVPSVDQKPNVLDVMNWWELQQNQHPHLSRS